MPNTPALVQTGATSIEVYYNSSMRIDKGTATVNGDIASGFNGTVDIRDADINGNLTVNNNSIMRLRPFSDVTVNGDVSIGALGLFQVSPNVGTATINGDIVCSGLRSASFVGTAAVITGSNDAAGTCNL